MRSRHSIANWLFDRLGLDVGFTGDLLEECARGRSRMWYLRQVLIAICLSISESILGNKLLALRAVAIGSAMNLAITAAVTRFFPHLAPLGLNASLRTWTTALVLIAFVELATGWVLARTHRAQPVAMVTAFAIFLILWAAFWGIADSYLRMLVVDSLDQPRFRPYLARYLGTVSAVLIAEVTGLFLGGMLGTRPKSGDVESVSS